MEKVIFLDIDGVLNRDITVEKSPDGWTGIDRGLMTNLFLITVQTGAKVVLTSTWKTEFEKKRFCGRPVYGTRVRERGYRIIGIY